MDILPMVSEIARIMEVLKENHIPGLKKTKSYGAI